MEDTSEINSKSTEKKIPTSFGKEDAVYQELMERKIPTLPTFPADRQLDGKNYTIWAMQMEAVLETYDLAIMVLQNVERPMASNTEEDTDYAKQAYQWDRLNACVQSFIVLNCTPAVLSHIRHMQGARQIWLHLEQMYNRMTPMKRAALEISMRQLDPAKCSSIKDYIDRLQMMNQEIMHAGKTLSSVDMAIVLLSKLPSSTDALGLVQNGLYKFKCPSLSSSLVTLLDYDLWHARFGHINSEYLRRASSMVDELPPVGGSKNLCRSCLQGKQHREPFPKQASRRGTAPLQLVHMDLCGPLPEASLGGSLYFLLLVDDFSRFCWVFFLQQKSDAFRSFSQWFPLA